MGVCEQCGNAYDKTFTVTMADGSAHTFDSFECAIEKLAPRCGQCHCRIIGHGLEAAEQYFCCHDCAARAGHGALVDRV